MQISFEGKIGIALTLLFGAGGGAALRFPDQQWIGTAMMMIAVIGLILLGFHHFGIIWLPTRLLVWWKRLNPYLIVAFFSAAIFIAAIIGYFIDKNSDKILWDYDKWPDTSFLALQRSIDSPGYPIWVEAFQVIGTNTLDEPILQFNGFIRSTTTNITVPLMVLLRPSGGLVHPNETNGIPPKSEFVILNPAVGVGRAADFCDFSTKSCRVSRVRGVAASATDGPEGKLGRLSRGFAASVAGPSTALHFLPARAKKWRQRETPSRPEAPSHVNSLR